MKGDRLEKEQGGFAHRWRLTGDRGNALDEKTLEALIEAFESIRDDPYPVILGARGRSFCTGLDLSFTYGAGREEMARLMDLFHRALSACFLHPAPVVAAISGHVLAGGALLALACDRRVFAEGDHHFGVHGIRLGVSYPQVAIEILRHQLPRARVEELIYSGRTFTPQQALEAGLVDWVVPLEELETAAEAEVAWCLGTAPVAEGGDVLPFAALKAAIRAPARRRIWPRDPEGARRWLDQWFAEGTQERLRRAREALLGREGDKPAAKG